MEEETKCVQIDGDEGGDEFYEKIEAPKFVDFTEPDPYRPDDRYWFCMRVGSFLSNPATHKFIPSLYLFVFH